MAYGLDGKVAIVTGAASGIGEASARRLVAAGARVCLVDIDTDGLNKLAAALGPQNAIAATADVADEAGARSYVAAARAAFGKIDLLHSNAGIIGIPGPLLDATVENFDRVFAVNVRSAILAIKHVVPEMRQVGGGAIVITASVAGVRPSPGLGIYAASKIALVALAKSAAFELGPYNIRVNAIAPGLTDTPSYRATAKLSNAGSDETIFSSAQLPLGRIGLPSDVANIVTWLLGNEAAYITGGLYHVDGGLGA